MVKRGSIESGKRFKRSKGGGGLYSMRVRRVRVQPIPFYKVRREVHCCSEY